MEGEQESAKEDLREKATSPEPSCVSMRSNDSMWAPPEFSDGKEGPDPRKQIHTATSQQPSCVSMKSNDSMWAPPEFSDGALPFDLSVQKTELMHPICGLCNQVLRAPGSIRCGHSFCRKCICLNWKQSSDSGHFECPQCRKITRTHPFLKPHEIKEGSSSKIHLHTANVDDVKERHKINMKNKYESLFEGIKVKNYQTSLNQIYTQLYIIEGESERVNEEHEVLHMEKNYKTPQDNTIKCNDIFKSVIEPKGGKKRRKRENIKTVVTKGIAGIGKTVSVQKFILDWAEGKANQDVDFIFVIPFRELNLLEDKQYCLHELLINFHPEIQDLDSQIFDECKVVFIFDGLDESRMTFKFSDCEKVSDITTMSSVNLLMSNLINGELLSSAHIWITSRPLAVSQIPSEYITRVTEIQGFNDTQKEEYFRKSISNVHQADKIISHIRRVKRLHIMCHIPVFCWISSTVLQNILNQDDSAEIPKTLTEMYSHFLLIQINIKNQKYDDRDQEKLLRSNREIIVKLAELAFKQLMKDNVVFYEEDLRECNIDVTEASVYSGICTEVLMEESLNDQRKVYSFIHLSFQEFLAAFYLVYRYLNSTVDALKVFDSLHHLHKRAIDKTQENKDGHLDLFLRFLLGISLESNQRLLKDLLRNTEESSESIKKTVHFINDQIKNGQSLSADKSINLFLCLLEVNDQTINREIQEFLTSKKYSKNKLSPAHCSAIGYILQMSEEVLDELDFKKYNTSMEGRRRLLPALRNCRKALLNYCKLTDECCETMVSALQSSASPLRELDLSNSDLQDSGVQLISDGLKNTHCKLEILRLSGCMVTEEGCSYLASALRSNPSHLRELDLRYNNPGDSGVKQLSDLLKDPHCQLQKLHMEHGGPSRIRCTLRKYACDLTLDPNTIHTRLILSDDNKKVTRVKEKQSYPDHPERFEHYEQVLCKETLTGRCYWEAKWTGDWVRIAMSYKEFNRKGGSDSIFGQNDKSWSISSSGNVFACWHNGKPIDISTSSVPTKSIGVYLDWPAGTISFYSVSDTLTHLHTFDSSFTEGLYAGFGIFDTAEASVSLVRFPEETE